MNRKQDDICKIQRDATDNVKKMKFMITNRIDLEKAALDKNYFAIGEKDGVFVPSEKIDTYSELVQQELIKSREKNQFGQLPLPTLPPRYNVSRGDVDVEDGIRNILETNKNSCNPRESDFQQRVFTIFNDSIGIETPMAIKSVENYQRAGVSSRFENRK